MPPLPRDPRTTPILELPVPGDEDPPDHVTYHGALADAIDGILSVPVITPAQLSQIDPSENRIVDMLVDATIGIIWRLRYTNSITIDDCKWVYVGGPPLDAYVADSAGGFVTLNAYTSIAPSIALPRQGYYSFEQKANALPAPGASGAANVGITVTTAPVNTMGGGVGANGENSWQDLMAGQQATLYNQGRTQLLTANAINTAWWSSLQGQTFRYRSLRITPIRIR